MDNLDPQDPTSKPSSGVDSSSNPSQAPSAAGLPGSDPAEEPVVPRFRQKTKPTVYTEQRGEIRREDTGQQDFGAQYFEWAKRARHIQELAGANKLEEANGLLDAEYVDSLRQEVSVSMSGGDALHDTGATSAMSPLTRAIRSRRLLGEKLGHLERAVKENQPAVDELNGIWQGAVEGFRAANKTTLAELHGMTPEQAEARLQPVKVLESQAGNIQQKIAQLNARFREIDPSFNVFSHPVTAAAARGLGAMANNENPSIFAPQKDPFAGFLGETLTNASMVAFKAAEGAVDVGASLLRPIGAAGGLFGDWVLRGVLSEDNYNATQQKILEMTGWSPDHVGVPNVEVTDGNGQRIVVQNRFGLPELASPLGAFLMGKHALDFANNVRESEAVWNEYQRGGRFWGIAGDVSNFVGGMAALGPVTSPFVGMMMKAKNGVAAGMAMIGAKATQRTAAIASALGNGAAQAAAFGMYESLSHGYVDGYANSFARGAETGVMFWALGAMGKSAEVLLNRKGMPSFVSQQISAALEGTGMAAYGVGREMLFGNTAAGHTLWQFLKDPTTHRWNDFRDEWSKDVAGMMAFKTMFGRAARRSNLLEARMATEADKAAAARVPVEEAAKRKVGEKTAEMLATLGEGRDEVHEWQLARYGRELAPVAKEIGKAGREEAAISTARTEPPQMLPGSLSGRTVAAEGTENLAERLVRMNRRQDTRKILGEGSSQGSGELGVVGTFIGGKMVFGAVKGQRGPNPSVAISDRTAELKKQLETRGHTPEEIDQAINERSFTLHNHPDSNSFSGADLANFIARGGTNVVVTDRGMFVSRQKGAAAQGTPTQSQADQLQAKMHLEAGKMMIEAAKERGIDYHDMRSAWITHWSQLRKGSPENRQLGQLGAELYAKAVEKVGAENGLDIRYFDAQEGIRRFGEFQKRGNPRWFDLEQGPQRKSLLSETELDTLGGENLTATEGSSFETGPEEPVARRATTNIDLPNVRREPGAGATGPSEPPRPTVGDEELDALRSPITDQLGLEPSDTVSEVTTEKREALARAYKTGNLQDFFDVAATQLSEGIDRLAKTPENVERVMSAAGIDTGAPEIAGAPDRMTFGRTMVADPELLKATRSDAELERAAREFDREGKWHQAHGLLYNAESYARIAQGLRELKGTGRLASPTEGLSGHPELPGELRAPTAGKQPSQPPPSDADAEKFLGEMLGRPSKLLEQQKSMFQRLKGWGERFAKAFKDPSTRELLAESIEKAGYRAPFRKLGADEEFVVAETDRLQGDLRRAPRLSMGDLADTFDPITKKEATPAQRVAELRDVQAYAVLRDQFDNRIRTHEELIVDDAGKPVLDAAGQRQFRTVETESVLPGNLSPEQWQRALMAAEERLTPEGRQAYKNMRRVLDDAWQSLVDRGLAREQDRQESYYPRKVVDYEDFIAGIGPMRDITIPREPFRGFLKARKGGERMVDPTPEALMSYLTKVRLTNAIHDYNERVSRGIEDRLLHELGVTRKEIAEMKPDEWQALRQRAEEEHGGIVVDIRYGRTGQRTIERDPLTLDTIAEIHAQTGMQIIPEAVVGRNLRPDVEAGRYLVTKPMVDLWRNQRAASSWLASPLLRGIRRTIGKWFKGPALRGLGGARVFGRNVRNVISDETAIAFKDSIRAALETTRLIPETSPVTKALAMRDSETAIGKLDAAGQSLARELQRYNTAKTGLWTSEVEGMREQLGGEWLKRYVPEARQFTTWLSKLARADFRWAAAVDNYAENLVRSAYFMRERMSALRDFQEHPEGVRPGETAEVAATRAAHLKVGEVLVNYDHLTPLERVALNGLIFPFYTWARYNFTKQLAETIRHPANTLGKYATYAGVIALANWLLAPDEESRLTQMRPELAGKGHLFLPWLKDEFGSPLLLTWEDTFTAATDFLGLSGVGNKLGAYVLGHGNESLLAAQLFPQGLDQAQRAFANATAPWVRQALDVGYRTSFQTVGERAENVERTVGRAFLPATDAVRYFGAGSKDDSVGARVLTQLPMLRFIDLSEALPLGQASGQFEAGRIQREAAQTSGSIEHSLRRFTAGLRKGDATQMRAAVDTVWADVGEQMAAAGQTQANLWARMLHSAAREIREQQITESSGSLPPKFWQLSRTQQAELLMRMRNR